MFQTSSLQPITCEAISVDTLIQTVKLKHVLHYQVLCVTLKSHNQLLLVLTGKFFSHYHSTMTVHADISSGSEQWPQITDIVSPYRNEQQQLRVCFLSSAEMNSAMPLIFVFILLYLLS